MQRNTIHRTNIIKTLKINNQIKTNLKTNRNYQIRLNIEKTFNRTFNASNSSKIHNYSADKPKTNRTVINTPTQQAHFKPNTKNKTIINNSNDMSIKLNALDIKISNSKNSSPIVSEPNSATKVKTNLTAKRKDPNPQFKISNMPNPFTKTYDSTIGTNRSSRNNYSCDMTASGQFAGRSTCVAFGRNFMNSTISENFNSNRTVSPFRIIDKSQQNSISKREAETKHEKEKKNED